MTIRGVMNLGYTGKPYDTSTGFYNYGYRDYKPQAARFTTVDPIRDGSNWFSYVNGDPVNYIDLWGLAAAEVRGNTQAEYGINPLLQKSDALRSIPDMSDLGCYFRVVQAVAEFEAKRELTPEQIVDAYFVLQNTSAPTKDKPDQMALTDLLVNHPDYVVNDAFYRLGRPNTTAKVGHGGAPGQQPDYIIHVSRTRTGRDHYTLYDNEGNLIYDPYPGLDTSYLGVINVYILRRD